MGVRRFRSIAEMPDDDWLDPGTAELFQAIRSVWSFSAQTCPYHPPPGVHRHHSADDARSARERWEQADFDRLWEQRGGRPGRAAAGAALSS